MAPRYDADYDARQCSVRNATACAACVNRIAFTGQRGAKGAWNKPCQGVTKPDAGGIGRLRCTYGGKKVSVQALSEVGATLFDLRPHTPQPEPEHRPRRPCLGDPVVESEPEVSEEQCEADMDVPLCVRHADLIGGDQNPTACHLLSLDACRDVLMEEVNALHERFENPRTRRTYRSGGKGYDVHTHDAHNVEQH